MSEPERSLSPEQNFPDGFEASQHSFRVVAAIQRKRTPVSVETAFVFEYLDAAGICVCIGPNDDNRQWASLYQEWQQAWGVPSGRIPLFGEVLVFQGSYASPENRVDPGELSQSIRNGLPDCLRQADLRVAYTSPEGLCLWEAPALAERRVLIFLAPSGHAEDEAAGKWLFWIDHHTLALLPRFLLHTGKLKHLTAVIERERPDLHRRADHADSILKEILDLHRRFDTGGFRGTKELLEVQRRLSYGESSSEGLIVSISRLRELRHSAQIAHRNLTALVPRTGDGRSHATFFERPIEQSRWLERQVESELSYLSATRARTNEIFRLTNLRLEHAKEEHAHRQHRMDLVQTISLGALLICLDAMHAFHTELPLPQRFQWPLIAVLMATAFVLPPLLVHWKDRYGLLERIGALLLGGAIAWLITAGLDPWLVTLPGRKSWEWVASLISGLVFFAALVPLLERVQHQRRGERGTVPPLK